jgi:hypothetical protein
VAHGGQRARPNADELVEAGPGARQLEHAQQPARRRTARAGGLVGGASAVQQAALQQPHSSPAAAIAALQPFSPHLSVLMADWALRPSTSLSPGARDVTASARPTSTTTASNTFIASPAKPLKPRPSSLTATSQVKYAMSRWLPTRCTWYLGGGRRAGQEC